MSFANDWQQKIRVMCVCVYHGTCLFQSEKMTSVHNFFCSTHFPELLWYFVYVYVYITVSEYACIGTGVLRPAGVMLFQYLCLFPYSCLVTLSPAGEF